ncbi:hypothetical protein WJX72_003145 [[Myrmecia] bisecta]|uniref:Bromo domain-containing protein n=1 Tax=[Myrmecia] bisecta TaxID=41462 RepID=A0AAW1PDF8_9CHLO
MPWCTRPGEAVQESAGDLYYGIRVVTPLPCHQLATNPEGRPAEHGCYTKWVVQRPLMESSLDICDSGDPSFTVGGQVSSETREEHSSQEREPRNRPLRPHGLADPRGSAAAPEFRRPHKKGATLIGPEQRALNANLLRPCYNAARKRLPPEGINVFKLPVSKQQVPDYSEFVPPEAEMCLEVISTKLSRCAYKSANELRDDFKQMAANARAYNSPGCGTYRLEAAVDWAEALLEGLDMELSIRAEVLPEAEEKVEAEVKELAASPNKAGVVIKHTDAAPVVPPGFSWSLKVTAGKPEGYVELTAVCPVHQEAGNCDRVGKVVGFLDKHASCNPQWEPFKRLPGEATELYEYRLKTHCGFSWSKQGVMKHSKHGSAGLKRSSNGSESDFMAKRPKADANGTQPALANGHNSHAASQGQAQPYSATAQMLMHQQSQIANAHAGPLSTSPKQAGQDPGPGPIKDARPAVAAGTARTTGKLEVRSHRPLINELHQTKRLCAPQLQALQSGLEGFSSSLRQLDQAAQALNAAETEKAQLVTLYNAISQKASRAEEAAKAHLSQKEHAELSLAVKEAEVDQLRRDLQAEKAGREWAKQQLAATQKGRDEALTLLRTAGITNDAALASTSQDPAPAAAPAGAPAAASGGPSNSSQRISALEAHVAELQAELDSTQKAKEALDEKLRTLQSVFNA